MVVRFVADDEPQPKPHEPREDIAEIIDFRTRLSVQQSDSHPGGQAQSSADQLRRARAVLARAEAAAADTVDAAALDDVSEAGDAELSEVDEAKQFAVRALARKPLSVAELRHRLREQGYQETVVEETVFECVDRRYLDDLTLARALSESLQHRRGASRAEIARRLHQRLIDRQAIDTVVSEIDETHEHELLYEAAHNRARKLLGLDRHTAERRLLGFLARRGWTGHEARETAREALDEVGIGARQTSVRFH